MIHSFLMIGQSNMAGRGLISEAEPLDTLNGRLRVLRNGRWQVAYRPINPDRSFSGTSLVESFAAAYAADHPNAEVGLIPCADGGSSLDEWREGGLLFENAVNCARLAMRSSHLVGILWHQGEADCDEALYPYYLEKLTALMQALRSALEAQDVPLVLGGLGDFLKDCTKAPFLYNYVHINAALERYAAQTPNVVFAPATGLDSNPDKLHFNHASLQELGLRYYVAFRVLEDQGRVFDDESKVIAASQNAMGAL